MSGAIRGGGAKLCARTGCQNHAIGAYCEEHIAEVRTCQVEGCPGRLGPHNRRGYCYEHRYIAMKVQRMMRALQEGKE